MKTNSKEFQSKIFPYILAAIDNSGYDDKELLTDKEKLQFLADTFKAEFIYKDNLLRFGGYQACLREWIMGLPTCFDIAWENYRIIELADTWGSIPASFQGKMRERMEDKILANWFNLIALKTLQLFEKHNVTSYQL